MIGQRVHYITFHPHRFVLTFARDYCAWFRLMKDMGRNQQLIEWSCSDG